VATADSSVLGLVQTLVEHSVVPETLQLSQPLAENSAVAMDLWWDHVMAVSSVLGLVLAESSVLGLVL
jgi:hypothetical protein